jgi:hypothetical protein
VKTKEVLEGLERECSERGVKLVYDELQSEGGLCRLRDAYYIIINRRTSPETRIRMIRDGLEEIRRRESAAACSESVSAGAVSTESESGVRRQKSEV